MYDVLLREVIADWRQTGVLTDLYARGEPADAITGRGTPSDTTRLPVTTR